MKYIFKLVFAMIRKVSMFTYKTEVSERRLRGHCISVVNLTPEFHSDERAAAKKQIAARLYEVFCNYVKDETST